MLIASQMLYPNKNLSKVDSLLRNASKRLRTSLIAEMEASQADNELIQLVCQSTVTLQVPWDSLLLSF